MRKFTVPYVSLHDVPDDLADCDGSCCNDGDGVPRFLDGGGLCCPDDLLDAVMPHVPDVDDVFMDTDVVISSLFPKADVLLTDTGSGGGAPLLPAAHASPSASSLTTSTVYSGCQSSTTTRETDSPAPVLRLPDLTVPRKKRHRPVRRRNQFWPPPPLDCTLAASAPFAPHDNPIGNDGEYSSGNNVGGGSIRRRVVARRRNRNSQRVCSHCDNRDTPQWRAGPDGPGTLCNACGIRYAMNKLLPEYRPSTSPSFRSDKHSNRHRKVVKLREQKDHEKMLKAMDGATAVPMAATYIYHHVNDIQSI